MLALSQNDFIHFLASNNLMMKRVLFELIVFYPYVSKIFFFFSKNGIKV